MPIFLFSGRHNYWYNGIVRFCECANVTNFRLSRNSKYIRGAEDERLRLGIYWHASSSARTISQDHACLISIFSWRAKSIGIKYWSKNSYAITIMRIHHDQFITNLSPEIVVQHSRAYDICRHGKWWAYISAYLYVTSGRPDPDQCNRCQCICPILMGRNTLLFGSGRF